MSILRTLRHLALGLTLIAAASALLLFSDRERRTQAGPRKVVRVALVQHASTPVLDEGVRGLIQGLAEHGFADGAAAAIIGGRIRSWRSPSVGRSAGWHRRGSAPRGGRRPAGGPAEYTGRP